MALLAGIAFAAYSWQAEAQPLTATAFARSSYRVDSDLVMVPVTVTDGSGASVSGLGKNDFRVLDNQREQAITAFYSNDAPCSVTLVIDVSGSVQDELHREKAAVHSFLGLANPEDDFSLVTVSSTPGARAELLSDPGRIEDLVRSQNAGGWTALSDAIYLAADRARLGPRKRRAMLVISDGMDNHSRYTAAELTRLVVESDVQIYSIAVENPQSNLKAIQLLEARRGVTFLENLAEKTGGFCLRARDHEEASAAASKISVAIRNQYMIGFRAPDRDRSEKWHRIEVKTDRRRIRVYARSGYRAQ
jgi:Ca-activated chloride channel family protein